uniref:Uncharacterized protein n=1 Tax=Rhizophora mucronata TaxID=61149 RepID=A0A2P2N8I2_RHIMU
MVLTISYNLVTQKMDYSAAIYTTILFIKVRYSTCMKSKSGNSNVCLSFH